MKCFISLLDGSQFEKGLVSHGLCSAMRSILKASVTLFDQSREFSEVTCVIMKSIIVCGIWVHFFLHLPYFAIKSFLVKHQDVKFS